jgi:hypothetical protein
MRLDAELLAKERQLNLTQHKEHIEKKSAQSTLAAEDANNLKLENSRKIQSALISVFSVRSV